MRTYNTATKKELVEKYILIRKGLQITIALEGLEDIKKLTRVFDYAKEWLEKHGYDVQIT